MYMLFIFWYYFWEDNRKAKLLSLDVDPFPCEHPSEMRATASDGLYSGSSPALSLPFKRGAPLLPLPCLRKVPSARLQIRWLSWVPGEWSLCHLGSHCRDSSSSTSKGKQIIESKECHSQEFHILSGGLRSRSGDSLEWKI